MDHLLNSELCFISNFFWLMKHPLHYYAEKQDNYVMGNSTIHIENTFPVLRLKA